MKILFNKEIVNGPWGGGNQMLMLLVGYLRRRGHTVSFVLEDEKYDVLMIMDVKDSSCSFSIERTIEYKNKYGARTIHRVNDNGSHRKTDSRSDENMIYVNKLLADKTIFISDWLREYYEQRNLHSKNYCVICNATDRGLFYPSRTNFVRGKNDPIKIITHHWSSNIAKGYDIYNDINYFCKKNPDIASFCFMGNPNRDYLKCDNIIAPQPYKEIPFYLRQHDVYVTASQFESGGCHIIEGMSCGLIPFVKIGGGGTEEYSEGFGIKYSSVDDFFKKLVLLKENYDLYVEYKLRMLKYTYGAKEMCERYVNFMERDA